LVAVNLAPPPAGFEALYLGAAVCYALYPVAEWLLPKRRAWPLVAGLLVHLSAIVTRGVAIGSFPLTNKFESFFGFSLMAMVVLLLDQRSPSRVHSGGQWTIGAGFYAATLLFSTGLFYPPPLLTTIWYPLHVPTSFLAYALWTSCAMAGLGILVTRGVDDPWRREIGLGVERRAFWGYWIFTISMVFGGIWGYVAWGALFLWDPKLVWSVILWLFYSGFIHLRYWPAGARPRVRGSIALLGFLLLLIAYIGTSFLFGHGSHSFTQGR